MAGGPKINKKELAITALLTANSVEQAAEMVGISDSSIYRWMKDRDFQKEYREARQACIVQAVSRLASLNMKAVNTIETLLDDELVPPHTKLLAAKTVLELSFKGMETLDLVLRIEELEGLSFEKLRK